MSVPQASRLPAVVAALYALAQRAKADGEIETALYGPTPRGATKGKRALAVFVGTPAANSRLDVMQGYDGAGYTETVDVNCNAISWSGGTDVQPHTDAVYAILEYLRVLLDGDPTLGGICERAVLGPVHTPFPVSDGDGASVELAFTVRALAYI